MPLLAAALARLFTGTLGRLLGWGLTFAGLWSLDQMGMLRDVALWLFEQVLKLVAYVLKTLSVGSLASYDPAALIGSMPLEVVQVFARVGGPEALGIVVTALSVRLVLRLIPFVRTGG